MAAAQTELTATIGELSQTKSDLQTAQTNLSSSQTALASSQASLATTRDQAAELGARVIKGYIEQWGMLYNATTPTAAQVASTGAVGSWFSYWPSNPFTGQPMADSGAPGDFTYAQNAGGTSYALTAHAATKSMTLDGTVPQQLKNALDSARSEATNVGIEAIQAAIDRYALDFNDTFPGTGSVSSATLAPYLDFWPKNPWTNAAMIDSATQGNYTYTQTMTGYTLTAYVTGGAAGETVNSSHADHVLGMRDHLKDTYCQAASQVLKQYVEEWKVSHGGTPPAIADMKADGAVGAAHGWWPTNPWYVIGMTNADIRGDFQYAPGVDGSYTLTVRQAPISPFTEYYTPQ